MSQQNNTNLAERAWSVCEDLTNHPSGIDRRIQQAVDSGDLDELASLVAVGEGILSQQYFYENGILEYGDEF